MTRTKWRSGSVLAYVRPDDVHVPTFVAQTLGLASGWRRTSEGRRQAGGCRVASNLLGRRVASLVDGQTQFTPIGLMPRVSCNWRELRPWPAATAPSSSSSGSSLTGWSELKLAGPALRQRPGSFSWCRPRESGLVHSSVATVPRWHVSCVYCDLLYVCIDASHIMLRTCLVFL